MTNKENKGIYVRYTEERYSNFKLLNTKAEYREAMTKAETELRYRGKDDEMPLNEMLEQIQERMIYPSKVSLVGEKVSLYKSNMIMIDFDGYPGDMDELYSRGLDKMSVGYIHSPSHVDGTPIRCRVIFIVDTDIKDNDTYVFLREFIIEMLRSLDLEHPVLDTSNANATDLIRIGRGYKIYNTAARVEFELYRDEVEKRINEKRRKYEEKLGRDQSNYYVYTVDELIDRAKHIKKHVNLDEYDDWKRLVLSLVDYCNCGFIKEDDAIEIAVAMSTDDRNRVINGGEHGGGVDSLLTTDTVEMTIGTFIWKSNESGYSPSPQVVNNRKRIGGKNGNSSISEIEQKIEVNLKGTHITQAMAKEWLLNEQRSLISAPPNSGKSTAFINAMKEITYIDNKPITYIMAVPTISIVDSFVDVKAGVVGYHGSMEGVRLEDFVKEEAGKGTKIIVCTFDKTKELLRNLAKVVPFDTFEIIVDEVHLIAQNYTFRNSAISSLLDVSGGIKIGLSGTPEPMATKELFDTYVEIKKKNNVINASMFNIHTYDTKDDVNALLATIKAFSPPLLKKERVLLFVGKEVSIDFIVENVKKVEGLEGINVAKIVAEDKENNEVYRNIVDNKKWTEGVDLIVSTNVISEGISIENNEYNSHIFLLSSAKQSPFFDKYLIRQSASRFRDQYYSFNLILKSYEVGEEVELFNYQAGVDTAIYFGDKMATRLNDLFVDFSYKQKEKVVLGELSKYYGVSYWADNADFIFDEFYLRQKMIDLQCYYYMTHRHSLVKDISKMLGKEYYKVYDVTPDKSIVEKKQLTEGEMENKKENQKTRSKKREELDKYLTKEKFEGVKKGNKFAINQLEKEMNKDQFETLKAIHAWIGYAKLDSSYKG